MIDLRGQRFGRLTVSQFRLTGVRHGGQKTGTRWWCICDCGQGRLATTSMLRSGGVRQCRDCAKPNQNGGRKSNMRVGDVYGRLTVLELLPGSNRSGPNRVRPRARVRCVCGTEKVVMRQALTSKTTPTRSCGCYHKERVAQMGYDNRGRVRTEQHRANLGESLRQHFSEHPQPTRQDSPTWGGENVTYSTMHSRLRRYLGLASAHECVDCAGQAQEWSYDHRDPNERVGENRNGEGMAYSTDLSHYEPRCKSCHVRFDAEQARNTRRAAAERQRAAQEGSGEPGLPSGA